jgi:uncharacterized spore protein YtfJ
MNDTAVMNALQRLDAVKDVMTVQRVFGEPTQVDGITVVPVAVVRGGGGGGGGGGTSTSDDPEQGEGAGIGFGVNARPVGVFTVKDGAVAWQPAVDVTRIVLGSQLVALAAIFVIGRALRHRHAH